LEEKKKVYDLEARTEIFSLRVTDFCSGLKRDVINVEYIKQIIRSVGSIAANYIEANENLGEKDLMMRIKICRKRRRKQDNFRI